MNLKLHKSRRALLIGCLAAVTTSCAVSITPPEKPIVLQINLHIKHEIELKVERDLEKASAAPRIPLAKKAGWLGERADGYVGVVRVDAPNEIKELALEVNEERHNRYRAIADKHKIDLTTVEKVAGK